MWEDTTFYVNFNTTIQRHKLTTKESPFQFWNLALPINNYRRTTDYRRKNKSNLNAFAITKWFLVRVQLANMTSLLNTFGLQFVLEDIKLKLEYLRCHSILLLQFFFSAFTQTRGTSETLVSAICSTNSRACLLNLATTEVNNPKARDFFWNAEIKA